MDDSYASEPEARISMMDKQGIEATLLFPSTGVTIENLLRDDPELLLAHVRAFNRWLADSWRFDFRHRIFSPGIISMVDADEAVHQLEFALEHGARAVQMLPGPATWGVSPADPIYDPFWARVQEAGVLVTYHLGNSGYMERYSADWGEDPDPDGVSARERAHEAHRDCAHPTRGADGRPISGPCCTGIVRSWTPLRS